MKKTTAVALIVLLAATMLFSACDLLAEPFPEETYIDTFISTPIPRRIAISTVNPTERRQ